MSEPKEDFESPRRFLLLSAAIREIRCGECRVTWASWARRLAGRDHPPRSFFREDLSPREDRP